MQLTRKQTRFVEEYVLDLNATRAAIRAGYSAQTANEQGSRLLANVKVSEAIAAAARKHTLRAEITAQDVLQGLWKEANRQGAGSSHGARVAALCQLGKYFSLFTHRTEATVTHRLADLSDEELMEELRRVLAGGEPTAH